MQSNTNTQSGLERLSASKRAHDAREEAARIEQNAERERLEAEAFSNGRKWALELAEYEQLKKLVTADHMTLRFSFEDPSMEPFKRDKEKFQQGAMEIFRQLEGNQDFRRIPMPRMSPTNPRPAQPVACIID